MEIWKQGDYFTSITTIRKYIKEAIELGQITAEDEEIFRQRKIVEIEQKENRKALLKDLILQELKTRNLSRAEMAKTIEEKTGIKTNSSEIAKLIEELITEGQLSQKEYKAILVNVRQRAIQKRETVKKKKELER